MIKKAKYQDKKRNLPISMQNQSLWRMQRRGFLKSILAASVVTQIPWWMACTNENESRDFIISKQNQEILSLAQEFLFPSDGNGPGAIEIKADEYLQWVLNDPKMDVDEKKYIINGLTWIEETAEEEKGTEFLKLNKPEQTNILNFVSATDWGESWYSVLLNFIFEALLSDPIYGSNLDGIGWKWLEHNAGIPRPLEDQKYGQFLTFVNTKNKANAS